MVDVVVLGIIVAYFALTIAVGAFGMRYATSVDKYIAASKLFSGLILGFSATSNIMTGFGFVGGPAMVYLLGAATLWITLTQSMAFGLTVYLLGKRMIAIREAVPGISGLGDIVYARFNSNTVRALFAIGILLGVFAYLGCQIQSLGVVLYNLFGIGPMVAIVLSYVVIIFIAFVGGMASGHLVNFMQGVIMAFAGVLCLLAVTTDIGGPGTIFSKLSQVDPRLIDPLGLTTWAYAFAMWWTFCLSQQPHFVVGFLGVRDWRRLKWIGVLGGGGYMLCSLLWMWVGYGGRYLVEMGAIPKPPRADDLAPYVLNYYMPNYVAGFVYAGLIAAILGTSITFLVLGSTAVVRDLSLSLRKATPRRELLWSRVATALVGVAALLFSLYGGWYVLVIGALGWGYFLSVMFPLFGIGLNWKRATREAAIASLVTALALNLGFLYLEKVVGWTLPYKVPGYVVSVAMSVLVMIVVSLFTKGAAGERMDPRMRVAMEL
jgi:Na+/proline symporter